MVRSDFEWSGATFSPCRQYRYTLWRIWDQNLPKIVYILLNPSTADETKNDPTVSRCQQRTLNLKQYGGFWVLNIFALRATDPLKLYAHVDLGEDPVGPDNDSEIRRIVDQNNASTILCGWGKHGNLIHRGSEVLKVLEGRKLHCFGVNGDGTPKHPLYLPYSLQPTPFGDEHGRQQHPTQETEVRSEPAEGS